MKKQLKAMRKVLRRERQALWCDYFNAVRRAIPPGATSIEMEWLLERIAAVEKVVGRESWLNIPMTNLVEFERLRLEKGIDPGIDWQEVRALMGLDGQAPLYCPDGGACHRVRPCMASCWRVQACGPLSGVYPNNEWPEEVRKANP